MQASVVPIEWPHTLGAHFAQPLEGHSKRPRAGSLRVRGEALPAPSTYWLSKCNKGRRSEWINNGGTPERGGPWGPSIYIRGEGPARGEERPEAGSCAPFRCR